MTKSLPVPAQAQRDSQSIEMARVWIAEQGLHCSLNVGVYSTHAIEETRAWGIVLADMARHVSFALFELEGQGAPTALLSKIKQAFLDELTNPTSPVSGTFQDDEPDGAINS